MPDWLGWLVTFVFLSATTVFLRARNLGVAAQMLSRLLPQSNILGHLALKGLLADSPMLLFQPVTFGIVLAFCFGTAVDYATRFRPSLRTAMVSAFLILLSLAAMNSAPARPFVYFAF
jgi:hypothetical protein